MITKNSRVKKRRYYYNGKRCSKGERKIAKFLEYHGIEFEKEVCFDDCLSPKGNKLKFDFFIPDQEILIEFQGHHHFHPVNKSPNARRIHMKTLTHDRIKQDFAINKQFLLLEIAHWEYNKCRKYTFKYCK